MGSIIGKGAAITVGVLMVLSALTLVSQRGGESTIVENAPESTQPVSTNYITHAPILITSNSNFAAQAASEGWPGNGIESNPYLIANYEINGSASGYCIAIQWTTVYFTIQNCYLHNASGQDQRGIDLYVVKNGTITGNVFSKDYMGMYFYQSGYCTIINNSFSDNVMGFRCFYNYKAWGAPHPPAPDVGNNITENIFLNNTQLGVLIDFTADIRGLPPAGTHDIIYRNNFINNSIILPQSAWAIGTWNWDYPIGGNYWTNYTGYDNLSGPNQDIPGSDGIGDTPFTVFDSPWVCIDHYPLMSPFGISNYTYFKIPVIAGWNLISRPSIPLSSNLTFALSDIDGDTSWNRIQFYDPFNNANLWKQYYTGWASSLNDLGAVNHTMSVWIYVTTVGDGFLNVSGTITNSTSIPLHTGWNMVGYPTLNTTMTVGEAFWGTGATMVETFDANTTYRTKAVSSSYLMKPGEGYWVYVPADTIWTVNW
ncbi:MAG: right-handed parallel beta-helix repeat-containing protein [Euryarchaeota archaeon]|nr:right-handed parallel beta-helix repeat-containing protein [Euryarchaeota archaeon]